MLLFDAVTERKIKFITVYNNNLNSRKAAEPNSIPTPILTEFKNIPKTLLTIMINISFQTRIYPEQCKIAHITPIFKKGEKLDIYIA